MNQSKLSQQQKEILAWAYVISRKKNKEPYRYWQDGGIHPKAIRRLIYPSPSRSENASVSRSFTRLHEQQLIERGWMIYLGHWSRFFLTNKGSEIGQRYATAEMWEELSHLEDLVPAIDING